MFQFLFGKMVIIITALTLFGFGLYGSVTIPVKSEYIENLPSGSHLEVFLRATKRLFPEDGVRVGIYFGPSEDRENDLIKLDDLVTQFKGLVDHNQSISEFECWWEDYKDFVENVKGFPSWRSTISESGNFSMHLSNFLFSRNGAKFKKDFKFQENLECGLPASKIKAFKCSAKHFIFEGPTQHVPGRQALSQPMQENNFSFHPFAYEQTYNLWEWEDIVGYELWRNLALAMVGVFVIILLFLAEIRITLMVMLCVVFTLIDLIGFLYFWGSTIDVVSAILIILTIGLCVDYSVHIAHAFTIYEGTKLERATKSVTEIGPAVMNGGITTMIALFFLAFAHLFAFRVFFKVFFLAVTFGLFHGLLLLPVMLSLVGPDRRDFKESRGEENVGVRSANSQPTNMAKQELRGKDNKSFAE